METFQFILQNLGLLGTRTLEHVSLVGVAVGIAILTGVPTGIAITQNERVAKFVLYIASMIMTIPSVALFGLMIPILSTIGHGIGYLPAVIAVMLYSQLPIIRNTYTAINNVDPALREAARGMGMTPMQRLARVEIPLAVPDHHGRRAHRGGDEHRHHGDCRLHRRRRPGHLHQPRHLADR